MGLCFFSRRRRHTSWPRDWSSDVCSSDLPGHDMYYLNVMAGPEAERAWNITDHPEQTWVRGTWDEAGIDRSEERRVGKGRGSGRRGRRWKRKKNGSYPGGRPQGERTGDTR